MSVRTRSRQTVEALCRFIEQRIRSGEWPPGTQLPPERELAEQFGTARNTVRRALAELEDAGRIMRHVGRGTFVTSDALPAETSPGQDSRSINPEEIMEVRVLIEPAIVDLIVARATEMELDALQDIVEKGKQASNMAEFEYWDAQLHNAMALASKNQYLIGIIAGVHAVRQMTAWGQLRRRGLTEERRAAYQQEHEAIVSALVDRDSERARDAIRGHLLHVRRNLIGY
ncbi:MAG: FadR/GntR family transcriptional regulator [Alphaproteobacteria bacterium]|nr:FadR/GntR family transcriptional regulator [Alphaproteobacteria bacterium]